MSVLFVDLLPVSGLEDQRYITLKRIYTDSTSPISVTEHLRDKTQMTSFRNRLHPTASATGRKLIPAEAETLSGPETPAPVEQTPPDHSQPPTFTTLPPEIHLLVSQQLTYPDALSLKHTNRYFYNLVGTGVKLKVDWLVERRLLHLECPNHGCDLGSDLRFCRGSIRCVLSPICIVLLNIKIMTDTFSSLLMQRRREHIECESRPGLGCLVYGTDTCSHPPKLSTRLKRWLRIEFTIDLRWVLLALLPVLIGWLLSITGVLTLI